MFLDKLTKKDEDLTPIGMLYATDGAEFIVEEFTPKYSRHISKIYKKAERDVPRQILVKNNGTIFEPYELVKVPLDLTKSSDFSNAALLEYLNFGGNVNNLIMESILDTTTILAICENKQYQNEFTMNYLAIYQNMFVSDNLISLLSTRQKIRLYTENQRRTPDIMKDQKENFFKLIKDILNNYAEDLEDLVSENPSDIRANIIKTCNDYYEKDISFDREKSKILELLYEEKKKIEVEKETVFIIKDAVAKYKITGEGWQTKKEACNNLIHEINETVEDKLFKINKKIEVIRNFPL